VWLPLKKAGVSKGTVSSVFTKKRYVSDKVASHVRKIAHGLNYSPNLIVIGLIIQAKKLIRHSG